MQETQRIAEQLRLVFEGPSWLGPPIYRLLGDVTEEMASRRPLPDAHTIWELVLHITAWLRIARERLHASSPMEPTPEQDWPVPNGSWSDALRTLRSEVSALASAISAFPPGRLDEDVPATEPQTFYVLVHGAIQHAAYHAGQIAMLKKASLR